MNMLRFALPVSALLTAAFISPAHAQEVKSGAQINFAKDVHDYGTVKKGGNGAASLPFTNTGNAPLIITDAKGSSGLVTAEWPKQPFAPGAKGQITVKYDTSKGVGAINKTVTITSNAVNAPTKVLRLKGKVQ